jgi:hypothetical protein
MDQFEILFEKDGLKFTRVQKNNYQLEFTMENNNIYLSEIIDFNLIQLLYDLNKDIYEYVNLTKINDNEANILLVMTHFFDDIGLSQKYSYLNMKKINEPNKIIFKSESILSETPNHVPENAELMKIVESTNTCKIITNHKINFITDIKFEPNTNVPNFVEKLIGMILNKIFKRLKLFIENIKV